MKKETYSKIVTNLSSIIVIAMIFVAVLVAGILSKVIYLIFCYGWSMLK